MDLDAPRWRRSAQSNGSGNCVEVAVVRGASACVANKAGEEFVVLVRDSKNPDRAPHAFTVAEWDAFLADAAEGRFDTARLLADLRAPVSGG